LLWNQGVKRIEVLENRPGIIHKTKDRICLFIDVAMPSDRNVIKRRLNNKLK
jgi:hypothetical protein